MRKYRIFDFDSLSEIGEILSAVTDSSKTLGLHPAISSTLKQPIGGIIWLLRKNKQKGHLEVIYDPGVKEITVVPVADIGDEWASTHARLIADYLSDRLGGNLSG